jgi:hypothetical protein
MAYGAETSSELATTGNARLDTALQRFKVASEADDTRRKRELEQLKFVDDPDGQWLPEHRQSRLGGSLEGVAIQPRPCLTIDKVTPAVDQVTNQARNARLAVRVIPKGGKSSQKTAEMLQGLYRNIEVESRAHNARMWALERAAKCGRGYYRVLKTYANDGDFDLDLIIARILNQFSVYLDPFHQEPDGSDAEWGFIVEDVPLVRFKREHKGASMAAMDDEALSGVGTDHPGWVGGDERARTVRVAEYFSKHYTPKTLILATQPDGQPWIGFEDQLPPGATPVKGDGAKSRTVQVPHVKWCKITALDVLDEQDWEGRYIPIIQVLGKEWNINGERGSRGIVEKAMDAQRAFNVMRSTEMETIGLAPKAPWLVMEGLIEGYEKLWEQSNLRNFAYLPYRAKNLGGEYAPAPQRKVEEPAIQAITIATQQASEDIKSTTNTFDPSLGNLSKSERSGKAIQALQQQSEHGNSNYLENLAQISMTYEARIVLDLIPYVYDRPGRIARILGEDEQPTSVMLNAPFMQVDGQPVEAPPDAPQDQVEFHDLKSGQYSVTVSVGKSFTTQREEANAMMGALAESAPQMVPFYADLWVRTMDFPGKDQIADRLQKMLPPPLQEPQDGQQPLPPEAEAQMAQMAQQIAELQPLADKNKAALMQAEMETQSREKIEAAKLQAQQEREALQADVDRFKAVTDAKIAETKLQIEQLKLVAQQQQHALDLRHQAQQEETDRQHDVAMTVVGQAHERESGAEQRAHEAELATQAAKSKPNGKGA